MVGAGRVGCHFCCGTNAGSTRAWHHQCRNVSTRWRSELERWQWSLWYMCLQKSMLQLPYKHHSRPTKVPVSSAGSIYMAPRHAMMQVLRPILGVSRRSTVFFHLILPALDARVWVVVCAGAALGAWIGIGRSTGVPEWRVDGGGMCGHSSVYLLSSKQREEIMGRPIHSTLHQH